MADTTPRNLRILHIGAKTADSDAMTAKLRDLGLDCAQAVSAAEAITFLHASLAYNLLPTLIVADANLPDCKGAEFVDMLRSHAGFADIPVIVTTGGHPVAANSGNPYLEAKSSGLMQSISGLIAMHGEGKNIVCDRVQECRPTPSIEDSGIDILIAEDNDINQLVLAQFMETTSWSFSIVGNGRRAVHAYRNANPRLILMDISMPEMDGRQATAAIRALEQGTATRIPIIALTAHALKGDREACLEAGMDDYLSKPVDFRMLQHLIESYLGRPLPERNAA